MEYSRESRILVVDDDPAVAEIHAALAVGMGYRVLTETNPLRAETLLEEHADIDLVLLDIRMPQLTGVELLRRIKARRPQLGVVMATVVNDIEEAVMATKEGAYNYLLKPLQPERLEKVLRSYFENRPMASLANTQFSSVITGSKLFDEVFRRVKNFAETDVTVLIQGETGTGKELIAQLIHSLSSRRTKPYIPVSVAALSPQLFESELFGHKKGSFTSAIRDEPGYFRIAGQGSLFLDEIGELGEEQQKKLLRVLQDRSYTPVGETQPKRLEARLIVATNRDLRADAQSGKFRTDLYYRLAGHSITLPALRDREGDVELLSQYFLKKYCSQFGRNVSGFHPRALEMLKKYRFPGNVRELEGVVSGAVLLEQGTVISPKTLPDHIQFSEDEDQDLKATRYRTILNALAQCQGNQTKAANKLGIARGTLNRLLKQYRDRGLKAGS